MTVNLPQAVMNYITSMKAISPELGNAIEQSCATCFMAGQLDEIKRHRLEMAQILNDTIPYNADLSVNAPFRTEVL